MRIRSLYAVIPAQVGIQTLIFRNDGVDIAILICYKSRFQTTFYHIYSDSVSANSSAAF